MLSLSAQASTDVPQDVVNITLFYEQEAADASSLTAALNQHADSALQKAKGATGVTARSGAFSIYPSTDRDGRIAAWRGRTEDVLESRDFDARSDACRPDGIGDAGRECRLLAVAAGTACRRPEADRRAIAVVPQPAASSAQAFGYGSYTIREVNIGQSGVSPRPVMMMSARAMAPTQSGATAAARRRHHQGHGGRVGFGADEVTDSVASLAHRPPKKKRHDRIVGRFLSSQAQRHSDVNRINPLSLRRPPARAGHADTPTSIMTMPAAIIGSDSHWPIDIPNASRPR